VARAAQGDLAAQETLQRLQQKFAEAIAVPINILDPHAIVIGGGVGNIDLLYTQETRQKILSYIFNNELKTRFLKPALGDSAGVFGAAMLTIQRLGQ
jgi:predicted NBD/HSP70 family sugar kinase